MSLNSIYTKNKSEDQAGLRSMGCIVVTILILCPSNLYSHSVMLQPAVELLNSASTLFSWADRYSFMLLKQTYSAKQHFWGIKAKFSNFLWTVEFFLLHHFCNIYSHIPSATFKNYWVKQEVHKIKIKKMNCWSKEGAFKAKHIIRRLTNTI